MKILAVDTTLGGGLIGGAQTFLVKLMGGLVERGHEVHLIADGGSEDRMKREIASAGVNLHVGLWRESELVNDITPTLADWMNRLCPDVFLVSVSPDIGWTVLPLLTTGIATLTIGHNDERTFYDPVEHYSRFLTRAVGVSDAICGKYINECGMPAERVEWIPYGVEVLAREPSAGGSGPVRLLYVGRLDEVQKRISDIVKLVKRLSERSLDFKFDIVGDGDEKAFVKRELMGEIAQGRLRLHGWLSSEEVIAAMRASEVYILVSAYEGFCISLTEAMANGCCPIVTDIESGNKQLVEDGVNGFVVPVGDVEGFVDKIKFLAEHRVTLEEMREKAWYTGRQYSVERMVENYVSCFERAIEDAHTNPRTPDPNFPLMESCRSKYPLWLRRLKARAKKFTAI